jgi:hypothetical protein
MKKSAHLNILLACNNQIRSGNMASRIRYIGHRVDLVSGGFQTLHEIEHSKNKTQLVLILGDQLDEMGSLEVLSHLRVVKNKEELFIIHVVDNLEDVTASIDAGTNIVLSDDNFNKINQAIEKATKIFY